MPKPRVLFTDHTATLGGGEIALLNLVRRVDRSRFTPVVLLFSEGPLCEKLIEAGIETHVMPLSETVLGVKKDALGAGSLLRLGAILRVIAYVVQVARTIRRLRAKIVHTNSLKADVIGGIAARIAGVPVLWHVRDRIETDYLPPSVTHAFRFLCRVIPDYIVANSAATLQSLRLVGRSKGSTIPSGIELRQRTHVVHDGTGPTASPAASSIRDGIKRVILVGRIARWKGQHVFLQAAALVRQKFPSVRFQIVGGPLFGAQTYEREIHDLCGTLHLDDVVEFLGHRPDVPDLIRQSGVLVHASITGEPFGQVIIEGMAAGKPVVATHGGGVPEIVLDGVTGILVPMADANAMAEAICRLLADEDLAIRMGQLGRQRVLDQFTIEQTAGRVQRVYDEILGAPS
jgi:glycosyltransferase involved in cell wall biosynthesis